MAQPRGTLDIFIGTIWQRQIRWARNAVTIAGDRQKVLVSVHRALPGFGEGSAATNQLDDASLHAMVRMAEQRSTLEMAGTKLSRVDPFVVPAPPLQLPEVPLWSDSTVQATAESRAQLATYLSAQAAEKEMLSAGSVLVDVASHTDWDTEYGLRYTVYTHAESSVTVRHPLGTGSGWAGESDVSWNKIDSTKLASKALEKCIASLNPVRIEPGRYTAVLERQAAADFVWPLQQAFSWSLAESGKGPFVVGNDGRLGLWMTKLGSMVIDERISISHDPVEPGTAVIPELGMKPITFIDHGVLKTLSDARGVGSRENRTLPRRNQDIPDYSRRGFYMTGGPSSVDEMIATTKRGLLVTRFANVRTLDINNMLATGVTRDGLWLIENGKITKPVKNLRFLESPLFSLNQIDQLGEPGRVFFRSMISDGSIGESFGLDRDMIQFIVGRRAAMVPPFKARDFNFVALVDAI